MKNIGITQRVIFDQKTGERRDMLDQRWLDFAQILGLRLVPVPNRVNHPEDYVEALNIQGLILSGGNNVGYHNKELMKDYKALEEQDIAPERENTEASLLQWVLNQSKPVVGVCHGFELMNVFFNGHLVSVDPDIHVAKEHNVEIQGDKWQMLYGSSMVVNSYHNVGITSDSLAKELEPFAFFENKEIEAATHREQPLVGIMWHPERYATFREEDLELFKLFFNP